MDVDTRDEARCYDSAMRVRVLRGRHRRYSKRPEGGGEVRFGDSGGVHRIPETGDTAGTA